MGGIRGEGPGSSHRGARLRQGVMGWRGRRSQRGAVVLGSLVMVIAVLSGLLVGSGNATKVLGLGDGLGWVIDNSGDVPVVAGLSVSSDDVDRRQVPGGEFVTIVDPETGEVVFVQRRVGGRLEWVRVGRGDQPSPVAPAAGEGDQLVVSGGGRVWLVDRSTGSVMLLASSGQAPKPVSVGRIVADVESFAAVDGLGRLFVATTTGVRILGVSRGRPTTMGSVASPQGLSSLVSVGGDVVGVSAGSGSAAVFAGARVRTRIDLGVSSRGLLVPSRSTGSVLWVLDPGSGRVSGTSTEGRRVAVLSLPRVVGDWNPPAAVGGVVMVSAVVDGAVRVWRGSSESPGFVEVRFGEFESMAVCGPGGCPEFFESGGRGWMNDPAGDAVLVIDPSGGVRRLGKGEDGAGSGGGASNAGGGRVGPSGVQSKALPPTPFKALPVQPRSSVEAQVRGLNSGNQTRGGETGRGSGPTPQVVTPGAGAPSQDSGVETEVGSGPNSPGAVVPAVCTPAVEGAREGLHTAIPAAPTELRAEVVEAPDRSSGTVTVAWTQPVDGTAVCGFHVVATVGTTRIATVEATGAGNSAQIGPLPSGKYEVSVVAFNNAGIGPATVSNVSIEGPQIIPSALEVVSPLPFVVGDVITRNGPALQWIESMFKARVQWEATDPSGVCGVDVDRVYRPRWDDQAPEFEQIVSGSKLARIDIDEWAWQMMSSADDSLVRVVAHPCAGQSLERLVWSATIELQPPVSGSFAVSDGDVSPVGTFDFQRSEGWTPTCVEDLTDPVDQHFCTNAGDLVSSEPGASVGHNVTLAEPARAAVVLVGCGGCGQVSIEVNGRRLAVVDSGRIGVPDLSVVVWEGPVGMGDNLTVTNLGTPGRSQVIFDSFVLRV